MVEVLIVMVILVVAATIFTITVASVARQRSINRESVIAAEAARGVIEDMRNADFREVYAMYNADPDDDPGGAGSSPGNRLAVAGLAPRPGSPDGFVCEVTLPALNVGTVASPDWQLREDIADPGLGMPRDLNGDSIVGTEDRSTDYRRLPVRIELQWSGATGRREFQMSTLLCEIRREGP